MSKRVLMIAFHYPPCRGSSGLQRALCFSRFLPVRGWDPIVLTVREQAFSDVSPDQLPDIPAAIPVIRAFGLDTARHLAVKGRYVSWMALPDRWISWMLPAVFAGLRAIRKYKPRILWSTYPIATSHLVGLLLHRLTGIPWVADFRDPMTEINPVTGKRAPSKPSLFKIRSWIERQTIEHCSRAVFVSPGALQIYAERYPHIPAARWGLISNGYDEEAFLAAERLSTSASNQPGTTVLLHSGELYPTPDRDPSAFFEALSDLRAAGRITSSNLKVILRASGYEDIYRKQIRDKHLEGIVSLEPPIPYREALAEMLSSDGMLLFQGYTSNPAIPAKFYEYLRAKRPIFAMVDAHGDTARALRSAGIAKIVSLVSKDEIAAGLLDFLGSLGPGNGYVAKPDEVTSHSREAKTAELASLLETVR